MKSPGRWRGEQGRTRSAQGTLEQQGVGVLGRVTVTANDAPRALTSGKPLSLLVPGASADCAEAGGLSGTQENRC